MIRAWVGLDVGTSSTKAVVHGDDGRVLSSARAPTEWRTRPTGVDLDPGALLTSAVDAANRAVAGLADDVEVAGMGITSMGETGVLVDRHGAPVTAAIAWHDQRDAAEVAALEAQIGGEQFRHRAGKPLRGQFSLTKHRWLVTHEPAVRAAVRRFNVAEWVARGLGADEVCDRVLACRTGWFDVAAGTWWAQALAWSGAEAGLMPPLVASGTPIGTVAADIAHPRLRKAIVTLAGHDHQAAALGVGADAAGDEFDSCGTAEALVRTVSPNLSPAQVGALALGGVTTDESLRPGHWSLLGGTEGGLALQRTLGVLGVDWDGLPALDDAALDDAALDDAALDDAALDDAALALPAGAAITVSGLGTRSLTIAGIGDTSRPGHVWRAVATAVAVDAGRLHDAITAIAGPHRRIVAAGGWCRSRTVLAAKREQFGPIAVSAIDEPGARGAAMLAARAAGGLAAGERWGRHHERRIVSAVSSPRPVRVVTVTPNPSLDRTVHAPSWVRGEVHRVRSADVEPSGKGVNVAVALHGAGRANVAVLPVGGPTGRELTAMLDDLTLPYRAVQISKAVRINTSIVEADGTTTKFNEPGPTLTADEGAALVAATAWQAQRGDWIAWCGSLPAGFSVAALTTAIASARAEGRLVALDTSGAALAHALSQPPEALPHLVKPNAAELAQLVGTPLPTLRHVVDAACALVERGVDTVLVSLGGDGAVLADAEGVLHGRAPVAQVANTVGAGDAFLAGYLAAVTAGRRERLASALCFGAAAVQQSGTLLRRPDASVRADVAPWTSSGGISQPR